MCLHWLCVRPDRLNSYGCPLCKVPPVADFMPSYAHSKPPASLIPTTELGVGPWPGTSEAPAGAETLSTFTARTDGPRRTRRRPGCPKARRSEGKPPQHGVAMPADGFASFLSASTGHAGPRRAKAQPVVMASERGWTRFGVHGNLYYTFLNTK